MPKKTSTKIQPKAKALKTEVLPPLNPFSEILSEDVLIERNRKVKLMKEASISELASSIASSALDAERMVCDTMASAGLAILEAWTCGYLLNLAKVQVMHGDFQKWVRELGSRSEMNLRTAQRYMQLAKSCPDARDLIGSMRSLRQSYIACGILPEPSESEKSEVKDDASKARSELLKSVVGAHNKLRRFSEGKLRLDARTKKELVAVKTEIDRLFKTLLK